ncbi:MAG: UPF0262 family protein [Hyphomicrobiales bacterium]
MTEQDGSTGQTSGGGNGSRLASVTIDEGSLGTLSADVDHERKVAIFDLLEENAFDVIERGTGPYHLHLSIEDNRLVFDIADHREMQCAVFGFSLSPFRKLVKDYFLVCESYFEAIKTAPPSRIEAIDMGRRGLHNDGSRLLQERLRGKIEVDFDTARRLFTLICVLHWKG